MKKESIMKLILIAVAFCSFAFCYSQNLASVSQKSVTTIKLDTAQKITAIKALKSPIVENGTEKINHIVLSRSASLDPNRLPMTATPDTTTTVPAAQRSEKANFITLSKSTTLDAKQPSMTATPDVNTPVVDNGMKKVNYVITSKSATLDPNRPPMMAIPATSSGQTEDKNNEAPAKTGEPK